MKDNKSKVSNTNDSEKAKKSTKKPYIERPTPNPPVPNRAHTEMKNGENK